MGGGKFGHGFISAGVTRGLGPKVDGLDCGSARQSASRIAAAAVNEFLTGHWLEDFGKQGSFISKALNLVPGVNATAGLHDYWLNPGNPNQLSKTFINNVGTMLPAAGISIAASIGNYTRGNEVMFMTMYHFDSHGRRMLRDE